MAEKIRYEIDVDASDAESELKNLGRAGEQAGKAIGKGLSQAGRSVPKVKDTLDDVVDILDDVGSKAQQAANKLVQMATKSDAELRQAAAAADALKTELGDVADRFDIDKAVGKFEKLGLSFEEIEADAKMLADTMKRVDDIEMRRVNDGITTTNQSMGRLRDTGNQSRSVLANLAGNAAQDLGQLSGVVGSLGVGIGQLAEYAVDGNIKMNQLAKVAGPMAGLAVGLAAVTDIMSAISKQKAFKAEQVLNFTEALREGETILGEIYDTINETNQLLFETELQGGGLFGLGGESEDLLDIFNELELSAGEVLGLLADPAAAAAGLDELGDKAFETAKDLEVGSDERDMWERRAVLYHDAADGMDVFGASAEEAADKAKLIEEILEPQRIEEFNKAVANIDFDPMHSDQFADLVNDIKDGEINLANFDEVVQGLADSWGISTEAVREYLLQHADEQLDADAAAAEADAEAMKEAAEAAREFEQAVADLGDTIAGIDADDMANIAGALSEALDVGGIAVNLQVEEAEVRGQVDEIAGTIQDFIDDHGAVDWSVVLDPTKSAEGFDPVLAGMISGLQEQMQTGIVNAFQSGGVDAATAFAAEFIPQLIALGMSPQQAREFMGLPEDGNIPLFLQLQIDKEAKADALAILNSIAGVDPNNPAIAYLQLQVQTGVIDPVIAEIAALLLAQKYGVEVRPELAQFTPEQIAAAEAALTDNPVTVPTELDPAGAEQGIEDVEDAPHGTTIDADADTQLAARQLLDETTRQRQATIYAIASIASAKAALDSLKDRRIASILAVAFTAGAEYELNYTARNRDSYIYQHVVPAGGGGGGGGGGPTAGESMVPLAVGTALMTAPMTTDGELGTPTPVLAAAPTAFTATTAVAPVVNNIFQTKIQAGMIGNRNEMDRIVNRAMRRHARLNGSRN